VRLLLIPSFTELEWGIRPLLDEWAEVATYDMPGVGDEPLPADIDFDPRHASAMLSRWREEGAKRGQAEVERRGWEWFAVITDGYGAPTACRLARQSPESVRGLAIGHASLSHSSEGERAPVQGAVWAALAQLTQQGNEAFVRYGIAQMTRGGISEELAQEMLARFPDMEIVAAVVEALGKEPEPIGEDLQALGVPLLLAKHEGCLGRTDEGFEDIVAVFPDAQTAICPEACPSSPAFADALGRFCSELEH
jgi:pimeloyl-ACP methyl ester carboxylesterase